MSATNRGAERAVADWYPTPATATQALFGVLGHRVLGPVLEPCAGDGAIIRAACEGRWTEPQQWTAWDIRPYVDSSNIAAPKVDFLDHSTWPVVDSARWAWCITNPPFALAREFVDQAIMHCRNVVMLLRLNFLGSQARCEWWSRNSPTHLWVLSERPKFRRNRRGQLASDATEYAWFGWCPDLALDTTTEVRVLAPQAPPAMG